MIKDKTFQEKLESIVSGKVLFNEPMDRHTSIGVGGMADVLIFPGSIEELSQTIFYLRDCNVPFIPVGNCTNLIVRDGGYRGVLVSLKELTAIDYKPSPISIYAEAGVPLFEIVNLSIKESLAGMEFCAGIPGSVGGGVKMNAGAFGSELKDVIETVSLMNGKGDTNVAVKNALNFEYRNLDLPEGTVILGAKFLLTKGSGEKIQERVSKIISMRKQKHPLEHRSAGSIFKNLPDISAGKIIDDVGLKGQKAGGAKISEIHGNFIVNSGGGKAKEVISLIDMARKRVWEERGVHLETEVKIIGID
ncbi:MAG: UDP-N-acetylmuramate dehydrogenase [Thermodesulfobacteriota bacterium]|nr:UDP-N-acetylmuramate dehydrogenase [Thermodesulfobacteriota bacterium]